MRKKYSCLTTKMAKASEPLCPNDIRFLVDMLQDPVIFKGIESKWNILSWSLEKWAEKLGNNELPFRSGERIITEEPQWESSCKRVNLTMLNFLKKVNSTPDLKEWYYFDYKHLHEWFDDTTEIQETLSWDFMGFPERKGTDSTLWIGSSGAHTPCHVDSYGCNLIAQIYGRKRWILFPPQESARMLPTRVPYEESSIYSSRNFNYPDLKLATELGGAHVVTLEPGDVLFLPHHWWHYVENIDTAISINTWIPMLSDNISRLDESLVRFFVSQSCKDLSNPGLLLNPNEESLIDYPLSVLIQHIEVSTQKCQPSYELTQLAKKRMKYEDVKDMEGILETIKHKYRHNLRLIPKISSSEFTDLIVEMRSKFCTAIMDDGIIARKDSLTQDLKLTTLKNVINSFCHPDVISQIREKLLITSTAKNDVMSQTC